MFSNISLLIMKNLNTFLFALFIIFIGCAKPPDYPVEPVIEYLSVSSNIANQNSGTITGDTIIATISFTDGDGDIGNDNDETTIVITDLRDNTPEESAVKLPKVPEPGANNGISGEIIFRLLPTCCLYPPEFEQALCTPSTSSFKVDTLRYEVYIIDRAGNESNKIMLEPIYVQCI